MIDFRKRPRAARRSPLRILALFLVTLLLGGCCGMDCFLDEHGMADTTKIWNSYKTQDIDKIRAAQSQYGDSYSARLLSAYESAGKPYPFRGDFREALNAYHSIKHTKAINAYVRGPLKGRTGTTDLRQYYTRFDYALKAVLASSEKERREARSVAFKAQMKASDDSLQRARANAPSRSYSSSSSARSSSSSSGLFGGSTSSGKGGLFKAESGLQALRDIEARRKAQQRQHAERVRRQQEEVRRQQEAARRQQELQRQQQQAAYDRQNEQRRQAEARRQQEEAQRQREETRRQRQIQEQRKAEARKQQAALQQQQAEASRRQEEERRRQELARLQQAANAATAAHCLQSKRLKGGFNVADVQIRNGCSFSINVSGACLGTSFKADYPYKGTYSPYESMGSYTLHPGKWRPAVSEEGCNKKGRTARNIACRQPFEPHFTSPTGSTYGCFSFEAELRRSSLRR